MRSNDISDFYPAEDWLRDACEVLGLQRTVRIVHIRDRWIWTLDYEQDPHFKSFSDNMMKLEAALQAYTKRPIDLRLERLADRNARQKRNVLTGKMDAPETKA